MAMQKVTLETENPITKYDIDILELLEQSGGLRHLVLNVQVTFLIRV